MSARIGKAALLALALLVAGALAGSLPASADAFGIHSFGVALEEEDGSADTRAGSHPFALTTTLGADFDEATLTPQGWLRDFLARTPPGLVGDTTAYQRCTTAQFLEENAKLANAPNCPPATQIGVAGVAQKATPESTSVAWEPVSVFNVAPPPGVLARLGFRVLSQDVFIDITLNPNPPYEAIAVSRNTPQVVEVLGAKIQIWGYPADPAHDHMRSPCGPLAANSPPPGEVGAFRFAGGEKACTVSANPKPFLTLPTQCSEPLSASFQALSWEGETASGSAPIGALGGCGLLNFKPSIDATPSTRAASSPSGLDFSLAVHDEGLTSALAGATAQSEIEKAVVALPEGMTVNPSQAEGLEVCSEADLERETLAAEPGQGCPEASKIGGLEVESPLVSGAIKGSLFVAEPYHNLAGDSLIAVYAVFKNRDLGIIVKQPLRVTPDPQTGRLLTTAEDIPQLPFSSFRLHFREGGRAPLISPPGCGRFDTVAKLYPRSGGSPVESTSTFQIVSGPNESACPRGAAPFHPGFEAGTLSNQAGSYSPFAMRLTRQDGEQDLTRFSSVLPPGVVGKVAGIPYCPESGIAQAQSRTGANGGREELERPSCPAASKIGRTVAGAGVGSQLTYVGGSLYLAGPYHGDPLSVVSITPAVAGPFDAGTVVVRIALTLNSVTGEVEADGSASDPIPHILKGIPLNVRDLRVYVDRPDFTLNATSCEEEKARATLFGGGTVLAPTPDSPVGLSARYQAANCASLGFEPKLAIKLKGAAKRGGHPALKALVSPRPGDANFSSAVVTLPHSAFLDQAHIRTICTRVQFAAGAGNGSQCPAGAVYGHATAWSPLLDQPLEGPVFLRSSDHNLPDLVVALHGLVDIDLAARIDSVHGGIRSTFAAIPDAPVSRFILEMEGGLKGLLVNSTDLCAAPKRNRAKAGLRGQNGKLERVEPVVGAMGCKGAKGHRKGQRQRGG